MNLTPLTDLFLDFASSSWRAAWLIVVLIALRGVVRGRIPAGIWFAAWIVVGLRLMVPFSVPVSWSPYNLAAVRAPMVSMSPPTAPLGRELPTPTAPAPGTAPATLAPGEVVATSVAPTMSWPTRLTLLWLSGVTVLAGIRLLGAWQLRRRIGRGGPVPERLGEIVRHEAMAAKIRPVVWCRETEAVDAPSLCGIFRPRLLFPKNFAALMTDDELRLVVRHELAHWRRRDLSAQALLQIAVVLHWYNPLAWIAARLARVDCELACDAAVLRRESADGQLAYGAALLRVVALARGPRRAAGAIAIFESKQHLAERVRMIAGFRASTAGRVWGGLLLVALLAAASATRESRAADRTPAAPASAAVPGQAELAQTSAEQGANVDRLNGDPQEKKTETSLAQRKDMINERLRAANLELQRAKAEAQAAEIRVNQINERRANGSDLTALPFVANAPLIVQLKQQQAAQQIEIAKLGERYRAPSATNKGHPVMIVAKNALATTEREIQRAVESICSQVEAEHDMAVRTLAQRAADIQQLKAESLELDRLAVEIARKQRELETKEQAFGTVRTRGQETATPPASARESGDAFQVSVIGAVNTQSAVTLSARDNPIVLDAIARAGGFAADANRDAVRLIRSKPDGSRETITLSETLVMSGTDPAVRLQRGDVIVVAERSNTPQFVNVFGAVNRAGRIPMASNHPTTLVSAITAASGHSRLADLKKVQLTRASSKEVRIIDVQAILKGSSDDVVLGPEDTIFVPERIL